MKQFLCKSVFLLSFLISTSTHAIISSPLDIANVWLWLDATDTTSLYSDSTCTSVISGTNGDEVACWQDKSGNSQNVSESVAARLPIFATNQFNGQPALMFDDDAGAEDRLIYDLAAPVSTNHTTFLVVRSDTTTPNNFDSFFSTSNSPSGVPTGWQIDYNGSSSFFRFRNSVDDVDFAPFEANTLKLYAVEYDGTNINLFSDGTGIYTGATSTNSGYFTRFKVNVNRGGGAFSASTIAEIIIYNRALNSCEFRDVAVYLARKYGRVFTGFPGGLDCTKIQAWWRADQGVTGTTNVTQWTDLSSNQFNLTSATGPSLSTNAINFHPAMTFDGATQSMTATGGIAAAGTFTDFYGFFVAKNSNSSVNNTLYQESLAGGQQIACTIPTSAGLFDFTAGSAATNQITTAWGGSTSQYYLWTAQNSTTTTPETNLEDLRRDGATLVSDATFASFTGNNSDFNLGWNGTGNFYNGSLGELILVGDTVNQAERDNVESYLGARYGITLDQSGGGKNYTASDWNGVTGTRMWTYDPLFINDIAVIGQDAFSGMDQRISKSQNPSAIVTISNGNDGTNPTAFDNDYDFLSWSNNGVSASLVSVPTYSSTKYEQLQRVWKVNNVGSVGNVTVQFDLTGLGHTMDANQVSLLYGTDASFTAPTIHTTGRSVVGQTVSFHTITLADASYFSLLLKENDETVSISSDSTTLSEPSGSVTITATLNETSNIDTVVNLSFAGSATLGSDYTVSSVSITIPAGSLTGTMTINVKDDTKLEPEETIVVSIASVTGATENGSQKVTISLKDNDAQDDKDTDGDGLTDKEEQDKGTDPTTADAQIRGGNQTLGGWFGCRSTGSSTILIFLATGMSLIHLRRKHHRTHREQKIV